MNRWKNKAKALFSKERSFSPLSEKRENGNAIDLMAGVFVMILLFAMILGLTAYGTLVEKRLAIDNTVKEYLYLAEQYGHLCNGSDGLRSSVCYDYCSELENTLVNDMDCISAHVESDTTTSQVSYGSTVRVHVTVEFENPLYEKLGAENHRGVWFTVFGLHETLTYSVSYDATSRW